MQLDAIKATNIELTDAIRAAVDSTLANLGPLTERFGDAVHAHVEVGKTTQHHHKGDIFRAEVNLKIPGKVLRAESETDDLYKSIDAVEDALKRQLAEEKDRFLDEHRGQ